MTSAISDSSDYLYNGSESDRITDALDYGWRQYDPQIGRWHAEDPLAELYDGFSPYNYALNNPVNYIDRFGMYVDVNGQEQKNGGDGPSKGGEPDCKDCPPGVTDSDNYAPGAVISNANGEWRYEGNGHWTTIWERESQDNDEGLAYLDKYGYEDYYPGGTERESNSLFMLSLGLVTTDVAAGIGEYSNVFNNKWKGANGKWNSLSWGGNKATGPRSTAVSRARGFGIIGKGTFVISTGISLYQGGDALLKGDYAGAARSGVDIGMGVVSTYGGLPGLIIGTGYFMISLSDGVLPPISAPPYMVPDATSTAPKIFAPK